MASGFADIPAALDWAAANLGSRRVVSPTDAHTIADGMELFH